MAFSKNDGMAFEKHLKDEGYKSTSRPGVFQNDAGSTWVRSKTGGSYGQDGYTYSSLSDAKKSKRF